MKTNRQMYALATQLAQRNPVPIPTTRGTDYAILLAPDERDAIVWYLRAHAHDSELGKCGP
jgi:hypothetical protein